MGYLQPYWLDPHFCPSEDEPDLPNTPETELMAIDSQNPFVQPFDEDIRPRILKYLEGEGITDSSVPYAIRAKAQYFSWEEHWTPFKRHN
jgi:hypothetical protein